MMIVLFLALQGCKEAPKTTGEGNQETWVQLFNGTDLNGWAIKIKGHDLDDNFANTFRVEDSLIKVSYGGYETFDEQFGHLYYRTPFSYYKLRVEYRFTGEQAPEGPAWAFRNSGIMFHCQSPETIWRDQDFPISIEAQFLGGDGTHERSTLNLCSPGTHVVMADTLVTDHCINSTSPTFHGDQWVMAELHVYGDSLVRHFVNGELVMEYGGLVYGGGVVSNFDPDQKLDGQPVNAGYIALQSESHPVEFRKVELLDMSSSFSQQP